MRIFRDKAREEFLENEIRSLLTALDKVKEERSRQAFTISQLEANLSKCQQQSADHAHACDVERVRADANEAYKTDNLTLIARVAHLQNALNDSLKHYSEKCEELKSLQDTVQKLLDAVERAKAKKAKKKSSKKKRR